MYLNNISFTKDHRNFKSGNQFKLRNKTFLVGDQGCGKSTMLECLFQKSRGTSVVDVELTDLGHKGVEVYYFDFEKHNPRVRDTVGCYSNLDGTDKGIGVGTALQLRFTSHGEALKAFSIGGLKQAKDCVVLLDEPESSLSLRNQFVLVKEINEAVKRNCQVIIATHCLPLIQSVDDVLSLEHGRWMSKDEFMETQTKQEKNI